MIEAVTIGVRSPDDPAYLATGRLDTRLGVSDDDGQDSSTVGLEISNQPTAGSRRLSCESLLACAADGGGGESQDSPRSLAPHRFVLQRFGSHEEQ